MQWSSYISVCRLQNIYYFTPIQKIGSCLSCVVVVVVNFISDRQYKNKDNLLTKQDTTLVIAVRGHQRSPWAHRAGDL